MLTEQEFWADRFKKADDAFNNAKVQYNIAIKRSRLADKGESDASMTRIYQDYVAMQPRKSGE